MLWTAPAATASAVVTTKNAWACAKFHLLHPFTWGLPVTGHWKAVKRFYICGISTDTFLTISQEKKKKKKLKMVH